MVCVCLEGWNVPSLVGGIGWNRHMLTTVMWGPPVGHLTFSSLLLPPVAGAPASPLRASIRVELCRPPRRRAPRRPPTSLGSFLPHVAGLRHPTCRRAPLTPVPPMDRSAPSSTVPHTAGLRRPACRRAPPTSVPPSFDLPYHSTPPPAPLDLRPPPPSKLHHRVTQAPPARHSSLDMCLPHFGPRASICAFHTSVRHSHATQSP